MNKQVKIVVTVPKTHAEVVRRAIGQVSKLEEVVEDRIEFNCPEPLVQEVIATIKKVHPYEEPAIDVYGLY